MWLTFGVSFRFWIYSAREHRFLSIAHPSAPYRLLGERPAKSSFQSSSRTLAPYSFPSLSDSFSGFASPLLNTGIYALSLTRPGLAILTEEHLLKEALLTETFTPTKLVSRISDFVYSYSLQSDEHARQMRNDLRFGRVMTFERRGNEVVVEEFAEDDYLMAERSGFNLPPPLWLKKVQGIEKDMN